MSSASETGVIHDIGYRRYEGPRLGATYISRSLFVHSLRGAYGLGRAARSKVMPQLLLAVMILPAFIIAAVANITNDNKLPLEYTAYVINLQVVVAIFVAAQSPQAVSRDLRFRVVALYFARPLTRRAYVNAKLLSMMVALFALMAIPLLVLYVGALLAKMAFWDNTRDAAIGLVGAAVFAVVLACIGLVVSAFTPRRGIGVAAVIAVLLVLSGVGAAVQGIADDQGSHTASGYLGLISPFTLVDGVQASLLGAEPTSVQGPPGATGGLVFTLVTLAVVAACYGLLMLRYRRVSVA